MFRHPSAVTACVLLLAGGRAIAQPVANPARPPRGVPESVDLVRDIPYAGVDNPRQMLDLLVPRAKTEGPLPVVLFIHGGAWLAGDKRDGLWQVMPFVASGKYAAASVGYRLSSEAQWPAQIHDCKAAIRWIRANADKYHLDADRIGVWGPSAGGHLVAVLGTSGDVEEMGGTLGPYPDVSSRVACVVDFFGPTDFLQMSRTAVEGAQLDHDSPRALEALLIGGPVQENKDKAAAANPITYVSRDDPPFLIVHGTRDLLVPFNQSELLHEALRKVDVESTLLTIEEGGHGMGFSEKVSQSVKRFFDHHLRGVTSVWKDETLSATIR